MSFAEKIADINGKINGVVWGVPMIILILVVGIWLTCGSGLVQFRHFGYAMKNTLGKILQHSHTDDKGAVTPFQAVTTALASTVGTGNIAGVAGAIAIGGPGAVFWMWISALVGMATKYSEVVLAIKYRERDSKGDWVGGPMYYIKNGLGKSWSWLAGIFCVLGALAAFGIGNIAQINSIVGSIDDLVLTFAKNPDAVKVGTVNLVAGLLLAVILGFIIIGGIKRIAATTEKLVPFMAVIYIIGTLVVIIAHIGSLGQVFGMIFKGAFGVDAVIGGGVGYVIMTAMKKGFARGIFSNEAGLGSAPMAHAAADTEGPVQQGLYGILEVFLDTIVICTLTALVILISGVNVPYGESAGAALTTAGLATVFGAKAATVFMVIALSCFAFSTILGWSIYGARCVQFLFGSGAIRIYQILFLIIVVCGATMNLTLAWDISDTLNALMAVPNLIALAALSPVVFKLTKEHFAQNRIEKN
ncbi:MAG: sodium:alanine symporter family protein [Firmicutes bacterium]|nr:sodium:alanine symporter family protein [Bacillota bacterium]